jgi:hypothetical protein
MSLSEDDIQRLDRVIMYMVILLENRYTQKPAPQRPALVRGISV